MLLVQLGHITVNLEYLITAEDSRSEPTPKTLPPGVLRITIEGGRVLDVAGPQADRLRARFADLADTQCEPPAAARSRTVSSRRPREE